MSLSLFVAAGAATIVFPGQSVFTFFLTIFKKQRIALCLFNTVLFANAFFDAAGKSFASSARKIGINIIYLEFSLSLWKTTMPINGSTCSKILRYVAAVSENKKKQEVFPIFWSLRPSTSLTWAFMRLTHFLGTDGVWPCAKFGSLLRPLPWARHFVARSFIVFPLDLKTGWMWVTLRYSQ